MELDGECSEDKDEELLDAYSSHVDMETLRHLVNGYALGCRNT